MAPWYMTFEDQRQEAEARKRLTDHQRGLAGKMPTPETLEKRGRLQD
jgi:hypothetical protein